MIVKNGIDLIGSTPIIEYTKAEKNIYVKLERYNPCGSIKDRAALWMIEDAERKGILNNNSIIIEPTSGNTGISLSMIGKLKGYKVIIVMPDTMSIERRSLIKAYGAELVLTDGKLGMKGAIEKALELKEEMTNSFIPNQFTNESNVNAHYYGTSEEILKELGNVDVFVAAVGTGGSLTGTAKRLKEVNKDTKVFAVEPLKSPVLSGGASGSHKIQGIGAGFIPEIYGSEFVDEVIQVSDEDAFREAKEFALNTGILVGISSGANIYAALELKETYKDKKIITLAPDGGEKYISMGVYD